MSGLEVAGVVLAAFPLILESLESQRKVARTWSIWWQIRREYQKSSHELKYHQLAFERNLKSLLLPLVAPDDQIESLLASPGGSEWQNADLAQQLEQRLKGSLNAYLSIVHAMEETLDSLKKELGVHKSSITDSLGQASAAKGSSGCHQSQSQSQTPAKNQVPILYRIKFSVGEAKRRELYGQLQTYNDRLEKLLQSSDKLAQIEDRKDNRAHLIVSKCYRELWLHADRLYQVLAKSWTCSCSSRHEAKMVLRPRAGTALDFMLLFFYDQSIHRSNTQSWFLQKAKVQVEKHTRSNTFETVTTSTTVAATRSETGSAHVDAKRLPKRSILKFKERLSSANGATRMDSQQKSQRRAKISVTATSMKSLDDSSVFINNLCISMITACSKQHSLGYLEDEEHRYCLSHARDTPLDADREISLDQLMRGDQKPPLNRRQRYCLALIFASSFAELYKSRWIKGALQKSDVKFLCHTGRQQEVDLDVPYLAVTQNPLDVQSASPPGRLIDGIKSLGIILLELCFGSRIEDHPSRQKYPPHGTISELRGYNFLAALEWQRDIAEEAGPDFYNAVDWCLNESRKLVENDSNWREKLVQEVVMPLQQCHKHLNSSSRLPNIC